MTPQIATPVSTLFRDDAVAERIISASDCLECRDLSVDADYPNQQLFHFEYELVMPWGEEEHTYLKRVFASKPDLRLISFHAAKRCTELVVEDNAFQLAGDVLTREQLLENAASNTAWLRSAVPQEVMIAVENNNDQATPAYEVVTDPDFVAELVRANDIALLFDIAHAHISAHTRGVSYEEYRSGLPLDQAVQLHLCSPTLSPEAQAEDTHHPPNEQILAEMADLVQQYPSIHYLTVEYYREPEGLIESIGQIRDILKSRAD